MTGDPGLHLMETMQVPVPIQSLPEHPSPLCQTLICHLPLSLQGRKKTSGIMHHPVRPLVFMQQGCLSYNAHNHNRAHRGILLQASLI